MNQFQSPYGMLPGRLGLFVRDTTDATQASDPLVGSVTFTAVSAAVQGHCNVSPKPGLEVPVSLFCLNVCGSGERKSAVQTLLFKAINEVQRERSDAVAQQADSLSERHELWRIKRDAARAEYNRLFRKQKPTDDIEKRLQIILKEEPKACEAHRFVYQDPTWEALLLGLSKNGGSAVLVNDEFDQFISGHMARHLSVLNSGWSGMDLSVDRKTSGSLTVANPRITCLFQAQPTAFQRFMEKQGKQARGNGFLARVLLAQPVSTQGYRFEGDERRFGPELNCFYERCKTLLNRRERRLLKFAPQAQQEWYNTFNIYEGNSRDGGPNANIRDFASKAPEQIARIAALLHAFETDDSDEISSETLSASINLVEWYRMQFIQMVMQNDPVTEYQSDLNLLSGWITSAILKNHGLPLAWSDILRYGPYRLRKDCKIKDLLRNLVNTGAFSLLPNGRQNFVGLPKPVHPSYGNYQGVSLMQ